MELTRDSGSYVYLDLIDRLTAKNVKQSSPRGQLTHELLNVQFTITSSDQVHVLATTRNPSAKIAATEAAQLIAGVSSLDQLNLASNNSFTKFADDGKLRGAYGPRSFHQLSQAVARLSYDSHTRQAVVGLWRGNDTNRNYKDVPCTLSWQFFIRDDYLHLRTTMRSNDAWLGLPYDLEMFSALHKTMASALSIPAGPYTHSVGSLHLYERDREKASTVRDTGLVSQSRQPVLLNGATPGIVVLSPVQRWSVSSSMARSVVLNDPVNVIYTTYQSWQDELRSLVPILPVSSTPGMEVQWRVCSSCRYIIASNTATCCECSQKPSDPLEKSAIAL